MRVLKTLGEQTQSGPIEPNDFDPVRSFRSEDVQRAVEWIGARVAHQRDKTVWSFAEVHRAGSQKHACARRDHDCRIARSNRRKSGSAISAGTRTTVSPISISTRSGLSTTASPSDLVAVSDSRFVAARRHAKSCEGAISSDRAKAEIFTSGANAAETARSLKSSDQRRRSLNGPPSRRSVLTSTNWFVLGLRIGLDIDAAINVQRYHHTPELARTASARRLR
jgi:hypothetical protein